MGKEKGTGNRGSDKKTPPVEIHPAVKALFGVLDRYHLVILIAVILIASLRIVSTYKIFNHTADEPAHVACGMEWLDKKMYTWEAQHPPLARIASAVGPYLLGGHSQGTTRGMRESMLVEGITILYKDGNYLRNLAAARAGILPFFWVACLVVYYWGRRYFSPRIGILAAFLFSFIPSVLAHSGLATTDAALTAFLGLLFLRAAIWVEEPSLRNAVWMGAAAGLSMLSKHSGLLFFPAAGAAALLYFAVRPGRGIAWGAEIRKRLPMLLPAVLVAMLVVWAGFRFSFGRVSGVPFPVPAPEFFKGIQEVREHNVGGHPGYLLGEFRDTGWWYFFEVALLVKSPLGFLILAGVGCALALRKGGPFRHAWLPASFAGGILIASAFSQINIGLRHVLPVYTAISVLAALGLQWTLTRPVRWQWIGGMLMVGWMTTSSLLAHPDYLPYFNELAGRHPENILVDSDLDWGQDINRLGKRLQELGAKEVVLNSLLVADFERQHGFPKVNVMKVDQPLPGWNAAGLTQVKERFGLLLNHPNVPLWIDRYPPREKVGKSILLWYFDPPR